MSLSPISRRGGGRTKLMPIFLLGEISLGAVIPVGAASLLECREAIQLGLQYTWCIRSAYSYLSVILPPPHVVPTCLPTPPKNRIDNIIWEAPKLTSNCPLSPLLFQPSKPGVENKPRDYYMRIWYQGNWWKCKIRKELKRKCGYIFRKCFTLVDFPSIILWLLLSSYNQLLKIEVTCLLFVTEKSHSFQPFPSLPLHLEMTLNIGC